MRAATFDEPYQQYLKSFPTVKDYAQGMREVFSTICRGDLRTFTSLLIVHSDLFIDGIFTFTPADIMRAYGDESRRDAVMQVMRRWSHQFNASAGRDPLNFLYSNPVLARPFIALDDGSFFWVLGGVLSHTLPAMLEDRIPSAERARYSALRATYLEDTVESLFRNGFPNGQVYGGSQWRASPADTVQYENNVWS